ncbi:hypothetical protein CRE_27573 [Caenorhabditis remanei]|uniref:Uncharacterized protein n=1 Tax=Caenorhabditis remanei TaxID=31234 RepID=E3MKP6_CAERE|nr:hypothetical protein CRE_27573 [Caenorhabditis remanei]
MSNKATYNLYSNERNSGNNQIRGGQDQLKRKIATTTESTAKKLRTDKLYEIVPGVTFPTAETMGIDTPMDPDFSRLPKGFKLGKLAREKFAGIVKADLYDQYEIQFYCSLFEHFSYNPIYLFDQDIWIPAHVHAYTEVIKFRTPPYVLLQQALSANHFHI